MALCSSARKGFDYVAMFYWNGVRQRSQDTNVCIACLCPWVGKVNISMKQAQFHVHFIDKGDITSALFRCEHRTWNAAMRKVFELGP